MMKIFSGNDETVTLNTGSMEYATAIPVAVTPMPSDPKKTTIKRVAGTHSYLCYQTQKVYSVQFAIHWNGNSKITFLYCNFFFSSHIHSVLTWK